MSDEQQQKLSRRAQRRESRDAGDAVSAIPDGDGDAPASEGGASAAETVREENRAARRAAASRRRAKRERERERALEVGLGAGEMVDDAMARGTDAAFRWVRSHFNVLQWVIVVGLAGWIGYEIYAWRHGKAEAKSTDELMRAVAAERGKVGTPSEEGNTDARGYTDGRRVFATVDEQRKAAREAYEKAEQLRPSKLIATLSDLGLAGVAYDAGKYGDAKKLYESVRDSELAKTDDDVRGRALEGIALCLEGQKKTDAALSAYKDLEATEIEGFRDLGRYSQARLLHDKGDDTAAVELLKKVVESTKKQIVPGEPPPYVAQASRDLLESIDPAAALAATSSPDKDALQKALEKIQMAAPPASANLP